MSSNGRSPNGSALRILVLLSGYCDVAPTSGAQMRRHHALRGIMSVGDVQILVLRDLAAEELDRMQECYGVRPVVLTEPVPAKRPRRLSSLPSRVRARDAGHLWAQLAQHAKPYDCVFVERLDDLLLLAALLRAPAILDMDDLESDLIAQKRRLLWRLALESRESRRLTRVPRPIRRATILMARIPTTAARYLVLTAEEWRWRAAERKAVVSAAVALACSGQDAQELGGGGTVRVVPNGFDLNGPPVGQLQVRIPPTVAFWGSFDYQPNADGARWFVRSVLPWVRQRLPDLRVLLVGRGSDRIGISGFGIETPGFVTDIPSLLAGADLAIVPLRVGGGTRIKIIEAWAHGLPVVSTTVGAYGLDVVHGRDAMVADHPQEFAEAILRTLSDGPLRQRLRTEGAARAKALRWEASELEFAQAILAAASMRGSAPRVDTRRFHRAPAEPTDERLTL